MHARIRFLAGLLAGLPASAPVLAQAPLSTAFTYQGQFKSSGVPYTGAADFIFRLYDSAVGGATLGTVFQSNVALVDGLFTVELDFGMSPFNGDARWVEVSARAPAGSGGYTLIGRQRLAATPFALYALNAPAPAGVWQVSGTTLFHNTGNVGVGTATPTARLHVAGASASGISFNASDNLHVRPASSFVGVNRSVAINPSEFLGIQAPVTSGYGGMYVQTAGANALPYYGYSAGSNLAWHYFDGATQKWHLNNGGNRVSVNRTGEVGIGTADPQHPLQVSAGGTTHAIHASNSGTVSNRAAVFGELTNAGGSGTSMAVRGVNSSTSTSARGVQGEVAGPGRGVYGVSVGGEGVYGFSGTGRGVYGQTNGGTGVEGRSTSGGTGVYAFSNGTTINNPALSVENSSSAGIGVFSTSNSSDANTVIVNRGGGPLIRGFSGSTGGNLVFQVAHDGTTQVSVLQITGGSDLAEKFDVIGDPTPGTVMEIDPAQAGKLRIARGAYSRRVAGVISGANDVGVGMLLASLPGEANAMPVALSGRVWVQCETGAAGIEPGDLLTTSDTPGYAMKVLDFGRAHGSVIGKAMSNLKAGERGLVLVLVNLQ